MSVVSMNPCIVSERWAEFVEWSARVLDLPVTCSLERDGWALLAASSEGLTVMDPKCAGGATGSGSPLVLELEVRMLDRVVQRATSAGAKVLTAPGPKGDAPRRAVVETPQKIVLWLTDKPRRREAAKTAPQGPIHFTVNRRIAAPVERVFEAISKKEHLERTFVSRVDGDLGKDERVTWHWSGHGDGHLRRTALVVNELLAFEWGGGNNETQTRVQFALTPAEGGTELTITELGWTADPRGIRDAFGNCEGWTTFLHNVALYLERGIASMP